MLKGTRNVGQRCPGLLRRFRTSSTRSQQALKYKQPTPGAATVRQEPKVRGVEPRKAHAQADVNAKKPGISSQRHVKRNELGVQLLSRKLHEQVFQNISFPPPSPAYVNIAKEHITNHGLDPTQGSVLPDTGFDLPPLQGPTLLHHFDRIGSQSAQPWLSLAKEFADASLPPQPDYWDVQAGWTKYHYLSDGSSYSEHVEYPMHDGKPETLLAFDVETLPNEHQYAIMACAVSPNAWYAWISPWLLGESKDPQHLVPFGDKNTARVVVGHNVSYDRARILEEYHLEETQTRFLDTMALHVAVKGISSHQRPAWMKYKKSKEVEQVQKEEAEEALADMLANCDDQLRSLKNKDREAELKQLKAELTESLCASDSTYEAQMASKRWEDLTSANSLADVAKLHCGIEMDKEIRDDFMKLDREAILSNVTDYLSYCATDVQVTHSVFSRVLPSFLESCPHPVSFAGILTMGSSFLCVNEEWEKYIENAEKVYKGMADSVQRKLWDLAEGAKKLMTVGDGGEWESDPWLSQLDWTPKIAGPSRGVVAPTTFKATPSLEATRTVPTWYAKLLENTLGQSALLRLIPTLLQLEYDGHPLQYSKAELWHYLVDGEIRRLDTAGCKKTATILSKKHILPGLESGRLKAKDPHLAMVLATGGLGPDTALRVRAYARTILDEYGMAGKDHPTLSRLDWEPVKIEEELVPEIEAAPQVTTGVVPTWYANIVKDPLSRRVLTRIFPLLLKLEYDGHPLQWTSADLWHYLVDGDVRPIPTSASGLKTSNILSPKHILPGLESGRLSTLDPQLTTDLATGGLDENAKASRIMTFARKILDEYSMTGKDDPSLSQLDWKLVEIQEVSRPTRPRKKIVKTPKKPKPPTVLWPKWYWDATTPRKGFPPGTLDLTVRSHITPLLLRLSWLGHPLFKSREHGWTFRVPANADFTTRSSPLTFYDPADDALAEMTLRGGYVFYKLPHKDGEKANVGSPLAKPFMKYAQDGTLSSPDGAATEALDMNSQCSYWISARDRVLSQMVVWQDRTRNRGLGIVDKVAEKAKDKKWGIILPQVITMGTVTRRAIEKTWLTASNAKKNRVGSELKAMVRAPPGYAIVGADVDSEELWISSCMGDAQFGLHGATALGWMTLEGTKAAGTDLHSKTASILGISRDQAKVFNYSRIYGAGMRHAILLLLQSNAGMLPEQAQKLAENLYASTKGKNTHRTDLFGRKFWFGGTESFVFNKLEEIALSEKPQTPALGCGVTHALSKEYLPSEFGADYMPSRINWVVQSSGVDYLHLLIVSMDHLIRSYGLQARYLISVHDELRYLVKEEDKYRVALALQIANLWTRSLFAMKLGMDDLPQGVAFFSAVDVDHVLRKEVDLPCVTPSQPSPIPPGESLDIQKVLQKTNGGSLWQDGRPMSRSEPSSYDSPVEFQSDCLTHRASSAAFLQAQATSEFEEIKHLSKLVSGKEAVGGIGGGKRRKPRKPRKSAPIGDGVEIDPRTADEEMMRCQGLDNSPLI